MAVSKTVKSTKDESVKNSTTKVKRKRSKPVKSVEQIVFARIIAQKLGMRISDVMQVVEEEQKLTMSYVRQGYKVVKKNYITLKAIETKGRTWFCPLNGKSYDIPDKMRVSVRVGNGFRDYVSGNKTLPDKLCRFVDEPYTIQHFDEK